MFTFLFLIVGAIAGAILASGGIETVQHLTNLTIDGNLPQIAGTLLDVVKGAKQQTFFGAAAGAIGGTLIGKVFDWVLNGFSRS